MLIKADMFAAAGEAFTYVEDVLDRNTTKTYNVTNGALCMDYNGSGGYIIIKDGELVHKLDSASGSYGTFSFADGVVTAGAGNYSPMTVRGFYS